MPAATRENPHSSMDTPFLLPDGNVQIAFSGGRSSACMLHHILQVNGLLPNSVQVLFTNTGREFNESLNFVHECASRWEVPITWLEYRPEPPYFETVSHNTASRKGEPFEALIKKRRYLPNQHARFCTAELKVRTASRYLRSKGWERWTTVLGIRADEPKRLSGPPPRERWTRAYPLAAAGVTRRCVEAYWKQQPFDLRLPSANGRTPLGNCDGCFLKSERSIAALIRDFPERADWWERMERETTEIANKPSGARFSKNYSRGEMRDFIERQSDWIFDDGVDLLCAANGGDCL